MRTRPVLDIWARSVSTRLLGAERRKFANLRAQIDGVTEPFAKPVDIEGSMPTGYHLAARQT